MANEITVLEGDGEKSYTLLFLFPVAAPVQVAGANVVPTPSSALPEMAAAILTSGEKAALDAGTSMFSVVPFSPASGLTNPQLQTRVKAIYAEQQTEKNRWYQQAYKYAGTRITYS
jgi:hypothetical protein